MYNNYMYRIYDSSIKSNFEEERKKSYYISNGNNVYMHRYEPEYWVDLELVIPSLKPYYKISSYGRIYSKLNNCFLRYRILDGEYLMVTLRDYSPKQCTDFLVHRLVLMSFAPIKNPELYYTNHKNKNTFDNNIMNLEWCTMQYNEDHKRNIKNNSNIKFNIYDNFISKGNSKRTNFSKLTEDQIHIICKCLEDRIPYRDICEKYLGIEYSDKMVSTFSTIKKGKNWNSISSQYNIPQEKSVCKCVRKFSDETVHEICKLLLENVSYNMIILKLGYNLNSMSKQDINNLKNKICLIKTKRIYTDISKQYFD